MTELSGIQGDLCFPDLPEAMCGKIDDGAEEAKELKKQAFLAAMKPGEHKLAPDIKSVKDAMAKFGALKKEMGLAKGILKVMKQV